MPQDILGHPACKVFVTHAGIHSIYEAAFHGVPIIGVPFQDEQWANAVNVASRGMGEVAAEAVALRKQGRMGHGRRHTREYMAALIKKVSCCFMHSGCICARRVCCTASGMASSSVPGVFNSARGYYRTASSLHGLNHVLYAALIAGWAAAPLILSSLTMLLRTQGVAAVKSLLPCAFHGSL